MKDEKTKQKRGDKAAQEGKSTEKYAHNAHYCMILPDEEDQDIVSSSES